MPNIPTLTYGMLFHVMSAEANYSHMPGHRFQKGFLSRDTSCEKVRAG